MQIENKEITINDFGACKKVLLKNNNTTFFFEDNELKYNYKQELNDLINKEKNTDSKTVPLFTKRVLCCLRANSTLKGGQIY